MSYPDTKEKLDSFKDQMFKQTEHAVEATDCETMNLWKEYCKDAMFVTDLNHYTWEQINPGFWQQIGKVGKHPVCVSCFWYRINGVLVCFYEATSNVVDHSMVKEWVLAQCPKKCQSNNAMNFHNTIIAIDDKNKALTVPSVTVKHAPPQVRRRRRGEPDTVIIDAPPNKRNA